MTTERDYGGPTGSVVVCAGYDDEEMLGEESPER